MNSLPFHVKCCLALVLAFGPVGLAGAGNQSSGNESESVAADGTDDAATAPHRRNPMSRQLTDDEMTDALEFIGQHMPNFNRLWSRMPPDRQRRMPPRMQWGFKLMLDARQSGDQRLYDVLAQQMRLRDDFISLRRELNRSGGDEEVKSRLLGKVRELVEVGIKQRELRIEKLEKMLEMEKVKLEQDRKNVDAQVNLQYQRLDEETSQFIAFLRRFGPAGGNSFPAVPPGAPTTQPRGQ